MKKRRKIYDRVFKEKAVQLSYEIHNISELARELDITAPQLYKWRKKHSPRRNKTNFKVCLKPQLRQTAVILILLLPVPFCT